METLSIFNSNFLDSLRDIIRAEVNKEVQKHIQSTQKEPDEYLTIKQVSAYLKVSKPTLWAWGNDGKLPKYYINGQPRYKRSEVDALSVKMEGGAK